MVLSRFRPALAFLIALAACSSPSEPIAGLPFIERSFGYLVTLSGDESLQFFGGGRAEEWPNGISSSPAGGPVSFVDYTSLRFGDRYIGRDSVAFGMMVVGKLQPGTYAARPAGTSIAEAGLSTVDLDVLAGGQWRRYEVTGGQLTITSVDEGVIEGTFEFTATQMRLVGQIRSDPMPASLTIRGQVARN